LVGTQVSSLGHVVCTAATVNTKQLWLQNGGIGLGVTASFVAGVKAKQAKVNSPQ